MNPISPRTLNLRRAIFVYEAARLAAESAMAPIVPEPWHMREPAFRDQFALVVEKQCSPERSLSPVELHDAWVLAYQKMGWMYGPVRDPKMKTHPDMVTYYQLGQLERDKDEVFMALCDIARQWIRS